MAPGPALHPAHAQLLPLRGRLRAPPRAPAALLPFGRRKHIARVVVPRPLTRWHLKPSLLRRAALLQRPAGERLSQLLAARLGSRVPRHRGDLSLPHACPQVPCPQTFRKTDPPRALGGARVVHAPRHDGRRALQAIAGAAGALREPTPGEPAPCTWHRSTADPGHTDGTPQSACHNVCTRVVEAPPGQWPRTRQRALAASVSATSRHGGSTRWAAWPVPRSPVSFTAATASTRHHPSASFHPRLRAPPLAALAPAQRHLMCSQREAMTVSDEWLSRPGARWLSCPSVIRWISGLR